MAAIAGRIQPHATKKRDPGLMKHNIDVVDIMSLEKVKDVLRGFRSSLPISTTRKNLDSDCNWGESLLAYITLHALLQAKANKINRCEHNLSPVNDINRLKEM